jgi:Na+-translocating ferredoxin:NAD+ oxidoreductase RNF subunit RnfB
MDYTILGSIAELGFFSLLFGTGLGIAAKQFAVSVDPKVSQIEAVLPSANCGACGYPGCSGFAKAVVAKTAPVNACIPGGADVTNKIAELMGTEAGSTTKSVAVCLCRGGNDTTISYEYDGIKIAGVRLRLPVVRWHVLLPAWDLAHAQRLVHSMPSQ